MCNGEKEEPLELVLTDHEQNVGVNGEYDLLSALKNEIIVAITEETEIDSESIAIMLDGNPNTEMTISVGFPKNIKDDYTIIQQIVKDSIKNVSEKENVKISKENITI